MADSPISHPSGGGGEQPAEADASSEQRAQMEQAYQQMQRKLRITKLDEEIPFVRKNLNAVIVKICNKNLTQRIHFNCSGYIK